MARNGQPVAKIIAWPPAHPERRSGAWTGQVRIDSGIVGPDPDVAALFDDSAHS